MDMLLIGGVVIAVIIVISYLWRRRGGLSKTETLRSEYRRLLSLPRDAADATIERQLESLREKYPGRSGEWYLEKMIYDLDRDR